jgi:hypothetical protein
MKGIEMKYLAQLGISLALTLAAGAAFAQDIAPQDEVTDGGSSNRLQSCERHCGSEEYSRSRMENREGDAKFIKIMLDPSQKDNDIKLPNSDAITESI